MNTNLLIMSNKKLRPFIVKVSVLFYFPLHSLFVSICDTYCSIHIIELLLSMMCLNKYFQLLLYTKKTTTSNIIF